MTKKVLIIIAELSETVEIVVPADTMRNAGGVKERSFGIENKVKFNSSLFLCRLKSQ